MWTLFQRNTENLSEHLFMYKEIVPILDKEGDKYSMVSVSNDKYLGDILQSNGKNDVNILERVNRGKCAVSQICQLLSDLCLGSYYFETANILRNSTYQDLVLQDNVPIQHQDKKL